MSIFEWLSIVLMFIAIAGGVTHFIIRLSQQTAAAKTHVEILQKQLEDFKDIKAVTMQTLCNSFDQFEMRWKAHMDRQEASINALNIRMAEQNRDIQWYKEGMTELKEFLNHRLKE